MNIRVNLNTSIKDGTEVVFRSPVDCSQITGLIVYYKGESGSTSSQEFALADAHGNNVGDIDHLFAENVVVKVILDVTTSMAFVQNADTNAYLEGRFAEVSVDDSKAGSNPWSGKNTVDKLCPSFTKSGAIVTCEPVDGYPLTVTAEEGATTITRCGKNLWDFKSGVKDVDFLFTGGTKGEYRGYEVILPPGTYTFHVEPVGEKTQSYMYGVVTDSNNNVVYDENGEAIRINLIANTVTNTITVNLTQGQKAFIYHGYKRGQISASTANNLFNRWNVQVEFGNTATAYEPYKTAETFAPGESIPALPGVNTIWADTGEITVQGKSDPTTIIEKLTNAIVALGGNV